MVKKLLILLFTSVVLAFPPSTLMIAQDAPMKAVNEARWQGTVIRSNPDKSTLTVRDRNGVEMIVQYDSSTRWVSQEHGSKKVNDIDASQVKDNDRVICKGTREKDGTFHATLISKRLSH
jgi:hypothetical protein